MKNFSLSLTLLLLSGTLFAQLELPALFADNMVLQQQFEAPFWGWAEPGESITITGSWNNKPIQTIADKNGNWNTKLSTPKAGGPYFVSINKDTLQNVLIGEVWVCSGQSNMQWALSTSENSDIDIPKADNPNIRLFYVARQLSDEAQKDCHAWWNECTPETAKDFSAVAYYFGKNLNQALDVPIGLIHTSWGGSTAQAWVSEDVLKSDPAYSLYYERQLAAEKNAKQGNLPINHQSPNRLYNAMIAPLLPYGIKGAIWYQGESNRLEAALYEKLFPTLIKNWRDDWKQGEFPFYFVQLAPYEYDTPIVGALLRDAQRKSLSLPNTGMAVTLDIGNPNDIHPTNKHDVGKRLALWALANDYGEKDLVFSGPLFKFMDIINNKIRLFFDHADSGLMAKGNHLTNFEIAGSNRLFYPAHAEIEGKTVLVSAREVKNPISVRYAFHNTDEASLFNNEGLPASSFRTNNWPIITERVSIESSFDNTSGSYIITLLASDEFDIYYTSDGTEPNLQSHLYKDPFLINKSTNIKAIAYLDNTPSVALVNFSIIIHLSTGKKVSYKNLYANKYAGGGEWALVNSIKGSKEYNDGNWQGFNGKDLDIIIDLEEETAISNISTGFLQNQQSWILFPAKVEYFGSSDGSQFEKLGEVVNKIPQSEEGAIIQEFLLDDINGKWRYLKVRASKLSLPNWHTGAGEKAWLFADEIIVN